MNNLSMYINNGKTELLQYVPEFYNIAEITNELLQIIRNGMQTWVQKEIYDKINVSVWIQNDVNLFNAYAMYNSEKNYIVLTYRLIYEFYWSVEAFFENNNFGKVIHLSEKYKSNAKRNMYMYMLSFIVAHELGHIIHGHIRGKDSNNFIDELYNNDTVRKKDENWMIQMLEYDADSVAATINTGFLLKNWTSNLKELLSYSDMMFLTFYLCFDVMARKSNRDFSQYFQKEIDEYDHPHPGIRLYYSLINSIYVLVNVKCDISTLIKIVESGIHAIVTYEKIALEKGQLAESFYNVGFTERGSQHVMNLINGWNEDCIDLYKEKSYVPLFKIEKLEYMRYFLNEKGKFI